MQAEFNIIPKSSFICYRIYHNIIDKLREVKVVFRLKYIIFICIVIINRANGDKNGHLFFENLLKGANVTGGKILHASYLKKINEIM
jgi:hypothetical protein